MATDGFDDLLAAYGMPDMATILGGDKRPVTSSQDRIMSSFLPSSSVGRDSEKDQVDNGVKNPYMPLMASAAAPRMASPPKATTTNSLQRFAGVSQVARHSPVWNSVPPGKTKLPQTSRKSVSQRRPKARSRSHTMPHIYPGDGRNYQSFNISHPSLNTSVPSYVPDVMPSPHFENTNQIVPYSTACTGSMVSIVQHPAQPDIDNQPKSNNLGSTVVLSIPYGNTLLSKANPLPRYKPPKPPAHLNIPDIRFLCTVCDDEFLFPTSLETHMKRRSLLLKFDCNVCNRVVVFYNKCAFHRHIQDHIASHVEVKINKGNFKFEPLSFDLIKEGLDTLSVFSADFDASLGVSSDDFVPSSTPSTSSNACSPELGSVGKEPDKPVSELTSKAHQENETPVRTGTPCPVQLQVETVTPGLASSPSDALGKYCWECSSTFKTKEEFSIHWTNGWQFPNTKHICNRCGLVMPTACSLRAHLRLFRGYQGAPHVCPECGDLFDGKNSLEVHTRYVCFHYARTVRYPCPICRQFYKPIVCKRFNDRDAFGKHLMQHSDTYYKCKCCPMAFKSEAGLYGHCVVTHAKEDAIQSPQLTIHKCPLCNTVFHQDALLTVHMTWHAEEIEKTLHYEFVCAFCMLKFGTKEKLKEHSWTAHKTVISEKSSLESMPLSVEHVEGARPKYPAIMGSASEILKSIKPRVTSPLESNSAKSANNTKTLSKTMGVLKEKLASATVPKKTWKKKTVSKNATGPMYRLSAPGEETASSSVSRPTSALSSPVMNDMDAESASTSENSTTIKGQYAPYECPICHIQYYYRDSLFKHRRVHEKEGKFICLLCSEVFNNKMAQVQHTRICFRIKKGMDSTNTQVNMFTCEICDETFFIQDELQKHMQELHSIMVLQQFACLLCGLTYDEKASLEQHIEEAHKGSGKKPTYMCWICQDEKITKGFGKRHLLEKHLQKEHKIAKNQIDYSRMVKPVSVNGVEEEETSPLKEDNDDEVGKKRPSEGHDLNGGSSLAPKRLKVEGDSVYNCAKCKFSSDERKEFQEHIGKHKITTDGIQCLECGMCFIVEPSLRKHLFIVHKIKDYRKYVNDLGVRIPLHTDTELHVDVTGGAATPEKFSLSPESNPLECKVCYRVFEDEGKLKKHMRTHGMAFIRSKRAIASPKKVSPTKTP